MGGKEQRESIHAGQEFKRGEETEEGKESDQRNMRMCACVCTVGAANAVRAQVLTAGLRNIVAKVASTDFESDPLLGIILVFFADSPSLSHIFPPGFMLVGAL